MRDETVQGLVLVLLALSVFALPAIYALTQ